jgi:hypothetical protein
MKPGKVQLDVDYIGGIRPLTKEDEQAISDFLKRKKLPSKTSFKVKKATSKSILKH